MRIAGRIPAQTASVPHNIESDIRKKKPEGLSEYFNKNVKKVPSVPHEVNSMSKDSLLQC